VRRSVTLLAIAAAALLGAASLGRASGPRPSPGVSIDLPQGLFDPTPEPWRAKPRTRVALDLDTHSVTRVGFNLPADQFAPLWMRVAERMRGNLSPELAANFDLFVYVNKAAHGETAQRMYVFDGKNNFARLYDWAVSTGREKTEADRHGHLHASTTPVGFYELDPQRFYVNYRSFAWGEPMPYAMFFNWVHEGEKTGLAIHATDVEAQLGSRASAGCVRLSLDHARTLFALVKTKYRGATPQFAYNRAAESSSNKGALSRDAKGHIRFADGYRVLVVIDDYTANDQLAALF
jgi:hypothetical protein